MTRAKKQNIIIASVLKPVNDVRLYQKIGKSILTNYPYYRVHIVGFRAESIPCSEIQFYPIFEFSRLNWRRLLANFYFFQLLRKNKPQILIIATWELLPATVLFKILFGGKIIYDVQENYLSNVLYTKVFPVMLRLPLALSIRLIELLSHPFITSYWLAEKCYQEELKFTKGKAMVLENKVFKEILNFKVPVENRELFKVVYAGTVSEDYGVWEAIRFIENLQQLDACFYLVIVGHCPQKETLNLLKQKASDASFIHLKISSIPLPHAIILEEMASARFILMPYRLNKSIQKRIPTKFYECMALQLPVVTSSNVTWKEFAEENEDFQVWFWNFQENEKPNHADLPLLCQDLRSQKIQLAEDIFWENQLLHL